MDNVKKLCKMRDNVLFSDLNKRIAQTFIYVTTLVR